MGYQDVSKGAVKQPMFGFTFTPIGGAATIKLGTVTATGMQGGRDFIQVINPTTLAASAQYTYYSDAQAQADAAEEAEIRHDDDGDDYDEAYAEEYAANKAKIGWWTGTVGKSSSADNVDVAVGSGFLGFSAASRNIAYTCSGEVPSTSKSYAPGAVKQPIVANFLPARMYLKDILVTGMQGGRDFIQVINPTTLAASAQYTYYSDAQAQADAAEEAEIRHDDDGDDYDEAYAEEYEANQAKIGWWSGTVGKSTRADNIIVEAGDAFLGYSANARSLTFSFKAVQDLTPITD